jgi:hypothetical protein
MTLTIISAVQVLNPFDNSLHFFEHLRVSKIENRHIKILREHDRLPGAALWFPSWRPADKQRTFAFFGNVFT